jgi:phosphopantothenoylcysteine decarboxylase/phosphopantothenate--cysteine ligase
VGAVTFEALTGRPVHTALIEAGHALDHIRLARAAHAVVVAPATADFLARAATGRADDLLSACLLATTAPVLMAPAMNDRMWSHAQTTRNVAHLRDLGYTLLDPDTGDLAAGEGAGPGRMPEPEVILTHIARVLETPGDLAGRGVLVTAGPTREAIDPVRYLTNRSSGKMGVAVAEAAWRRGARVTLVCGPLSVPAPVGALVIPVETAEEMQVAVGQALEKADVLVMAAAPADFRPATQASEKIKKATAPSEIALAATPDILVSTQGARNPGTVVVGFALETEDVLANGRKKLEAKDLDLVVVNDAREEGAGFGVDTNRVTFLTRQSQPEVLPLMPKTEVADAILDRVVGLLR